MFNKEKIAKLEKDTQAFLFLFQWLHREGRVHKSGETHERNITSGIDPLGFGKSIGRFITPICKGHNRICIGAENDKYAHKLLDGYYHEVGPKRVKLAVRWLISDTLGEDDRANFIALHVYWPKRSQILSGKPSQQTMGGPYLLDDDTQFDDIRDDRVEKARETVWNFLDYVSLSRVALVSASPQN
ncbi:hypothetical protein OROGR_021294 [Orobanche gracilis]